MENFEPLDLIVLDDGVQGVAVRLLSPTPQLGYYDAEADEADTLFTGTWASEGRTAYLALVAEDHPGPDRPQGRVA
ncbi:hypothetical protein ACFZAV_14665 [Streptomyces sp. NPDC008343]|uniref:hypothetical protein n=1 Tax=Streptomyces sp. NPDC008343 TaxID=3364828 RepID=UPI0036EDCE41